MRLSITYYSTKGINLSLDRKIRKSFLKENIKLLSSYYNPWNKKRELIFYTEGKGD